ncbi:putative glycoprotein hormone G-protein coupled receptor [Trichoplax sp. H2]|uniref:G-protein coupled receptors family 1 profile domain-containing protein n=1 Tax=Trichoplax adhaerens TaxID=10228 RepID=B3S491_TRIAD|nr:hypothetical protein TRIADDRAFT_59000 [Trichoplax adhaerens]EDV22415.1 hypothetical protein TRIADDRAFT_59000 [Trichoplax adhaerens]RDD40976.1 putative glycoprotein hormone G-protein coupled receptor [Trichoplax sp. H2]|eukprot:XP_002114959.1 hypothetical protein TRIADDRAFT_59000 [Trichoplax adhaerens]
MTSLFNNSIVALASAWTCGLGGIVANLYVMTTCISNYRYRIKEVTAAMQISEASRLNLNITSPSRDYQNKKRIKMGKVAILFFVNLSMADMMSSLYLVILAIADACADSETKSYLIYANESKTIYVNRSIVGEQLKIWNHSFLCQFLRFLTISGSTISVWMTLMIAIDRFVLIVYPLKMNWKFTLRRTIWICRLIWLYGCGCGLLAVILAKLTSHKRTNSWYSRLCIIDNLDNDLVIAFAAFLSVNSLLIYIVVSVLLFISLYHVRKSPVRIKSQVNNRTRSYIRKIGAETSLVITSIIVVTNIFCWLPTTAISLLYALGVTKIGKVMFGPYGTWITLLFPVNGFLNPIVFIVLIHLRYFKRKKSLSILVISKAD